MISHATIVSMFIPIIFSFVLFIGLIMITKKKIGVSKKPLILGATGFIIFTQVLEKLLHLLVVTSFPTYAEHPWLFGIYGGMAAGLFEEFGRFLLFVWLLKAYREYKDGISFGVGWSGIEAVVLMLMMGVPNILFAFMINAGTFESTLAKDLPLQQITMLKENLLHQGISFYLLATVERFFAVFMQIAFTLLVFKGVLTKKPSYVWFAVFLHALVDFPLVFFQTGHMVNIWVIEGYVALIGIVSIIFLKKSRKWIQS